MSKFAPNTVFFFIALSKLCLPCFSLDIASFSGLGFCKNEGLANFKSFNLARKLLPRMQASEATSQLCSLQKEGLIRVEKNKLERFVCRNGLLFNVIFNLSPDKKYKAFFRYYCVTDLDRKGFRLYRIRKSDGELVRLRRDGNISWKELRAQLFHLINS